MSKLVSDLLRNGYLKTNSIIDAFAIIDRVEFVPNGLEEGSDKDVELPVGYGQTISQPSTVAFMLELLDPQEGQTILDIGSGSGWTTALLSYIVGEKGRVVAIDAVNDLVEYAKKHVDRFDFIKKGIAEFYCADGSKGFAEKAPYDRILCSASVDEVPQSFKDQLKVGGKLVMPVRNSIVYMEKKSETEFSEENFPGFLFIPLMSEE